MHCRDFLLWGFNIRWQGKHSHHNALSKSFTSSLMMHPYTSSQAISPPVLLELASVNVAITVIRLLGWLQPLNRKALLFILWPASLAASITLLVCLLEIKGIFQIRFSIARTDYVDEKYQKVLGGLLVINCEVSAICEVFL
jgi:hypothetical protein